MHRNGAAYIDADMIGIYIHSYGIGCAYIAQTSGVNIRHLHNWHTLHSRVITKSCNPVKSRLLYIFSENFSRCRITYNFHVFFAQSCDTGAQ
jgi:hypothetical protein